MSVVPYGFANSTTPLFEEHNPIEYGALTDDTFPDPLVPGVVSFYNLKSGNPARAGQEDEYSVSVTIVLSITNPQVVARNRIDISIGGISVTWGGGIAGTNPGNGQPFPPPNPTQVSTMVLTSNIVNGGTVQITLTGKCIVLAQNGIRMGIRYDEYDPETSTFNILGLVYQYTYLGPR